MVNDHFLHLFDRCVKRYRNGDKTYTSYYDDEDIELLRAIGYRSREFFDFIEDWCDEGAPSPSDALLVAAVRRDYFNVVLKGEIAQPTVTRDNIPTFGDTLDGIGGFDTYGEAENMSAIVAERLLPMALAEGCKLRRAVSDGQTLTFDDVELPPGRLIDRTYSEMLQLFKLPDAIAGAHMESAS